MDRLRATPGLEQVPIILMSARMSHEEGAEHRLRVLPRPFQFKALLRLVRE